MAGSKLTPCGALFAVMKKQAGMSHKELAGLLLSGRPLADGRSPASRVGDRTWVSRFVVNAPVGSLQERYFSDFGTAALRIIARLRAREHRGMNGAQILALVLGPGRTAMKEALASCRQDGALFDNALNRLIGGEGYTDDERAEIAMTFLVAVACTANVRKAALYTVDYLQAVRGGKLAATPAAQFSSASESPDDREALALGLVRVEDGYVKGGAHWVMPQGDGAIIGALALGEADISDVGPCVSGRHARVWRDGDGRWFVEDLGSRNGTVLISGTDRSEVVVAPPRNDVERCAGGEASDAGEGVSCGEQRAGEEPRSGAPVEIHPGDELVLGGDTVFALVAGLAE